MSSIILTVPQAIKQLRTMRGWTQSDLAAQLNRSLQAVASWEQGRFEPHRDVYQKLAELATGRLAEFFASKSGMPAQDPKDDRLKALESGMARLEQQMTQGFASIEAALRARPTGVSLRKGTRVRAPGPRLIAQNGER